jgi:hypothetical protein
MFILQPRVGSFPASGLPFQLFDTLLQLPELVGQVRTTGRRGDRRRRGGAVTPFREQRLRPNHRNVVFAVAGEFEISGLQIQLKSSLFGAVLARKKEARVTPRKAF